MTGSWKKGSMASPDAPQGLLKREIPAPRAVKLAFRGVVIDQNPHTDARICTVATRTPRPGQPDRLRKYTVVVQRGFFSMSATSLTGPVDASADDTIFMKSK